MLSLGEGGIQTKKHFIHNGNNGTMNEMQSIEEWARQRRGVSETIGLRAAVLIGAGEMGLQVAIQLALLGMPRLTLLDDNVLWTVDRVAQWNALIAVVCQRISPAMHITTHRERGSSMPWSGLPAGNNLAVFCATSCCVTRRLIWATCFPYALFFVDGRMNAETVRVIAVDNPKDARTIQARCRATTSRVDASSAQTNIGMAAVAAGLMIHQFVTWLRGEAAACDMTIGLQTPDVNVSSD